MAKIRPQVANPKQVLALCCAVARAIPTASNPERHEWNVARLLFSTVAHESDGFRARRQYGFTAHSTKGAFGLWQCEWGSISSSLQALVYRPAINEQCIAWVDTFGISRDCLLPSNQPQTLLLLQEEKGDPLSAMFARLHYKWIPEAVPENIYDIAAYAKKYYNTYRGKARESDYRTAYEKYWPYSECDQVTLFSRLTAEVTGSG
jgi:hypothetical protein